MRTSDQLNKLADEFHLSQFTLHRVMEALPEGATLEIMQSVDARTATIIRLLREEAAYLRFIQ